MVKFLLFFIGSYAFSFADTLSLDLGNASGSMVARIIQLFLLITILGLAPSLVIMVTSFTRIVVVLSFTRHAIGLQQSPPNMVLLGIASFLTLFIMGPTFEKIYNDGISPLINEKITEEEAFYKCTKPLARFMLKNVRQQDLGLFLEYVKEKPATPEDTPLRALVPAFMISELKRAFEIGFLIFVPFLVIDLVIASLLMSMGMMMLPPVMVSMPFKVIFFVLVDGWYLLCGNLIKSFQMD
ncbi:MAG: flagellar type III secretion system pore protein FliP [Alphaproteobacteria bacterium]